MANNRYTKVIIQQHNDTFLFDWDKAKTFEEIWSDIRERARLPMETNAYSLKLLHRNKQRNVNQYINAQNYGMIEDLDELQIVLSAAHNLMSVFKMITGETRTTGFELLSKMCIEPEFVKEMAAKHLHLELMDLFEAQCDSLSHQEIQACLLTFAHLIKFELITEPNPNILDKILILIGRRNSRASIASMQSLNNLNISQQAEDEDLTVSYCLLVVRNILVSRLPGLVVWREEILRSIHYRTLLEDFIRDRKHIGLKHRALSLLCSMLKVTKGDSRAGIIRELFKQQARLVIYDNLIIGFKPDQEKNVAHELYIYQTHLLSFYKDVLKVEIKVDKAIIQEFCPVERDLNRYSVLCDYDELLDSDNRHSYQFDVADDRRRLRLSLASILSDTSRPSSYMSSVYTPNSVNFDDLSVSALTLECLRYYKQNHPVTFKQSQLEDKYYKPGIFATSQLVVNMLCKLLHVCVSPRRNRNIYQPLFFTQDCFFSELFSRTMWLLSKTRHEMKAFSFSDFNKAMTVLHQQLRTILEAKHMTKGGLIKDFAEASFTKVMDYWTKKNKEEMDVLLEKHPCVRELKERYQRTNEPLIFERRINYMHEPTEMVKALMDNKKLLKQTKAKIVLSSNNKMVTITETTKGKEVATTYGIDTIEGMAHGRNCEQYITSCASDPLRAFSIILENNEKIQFVAMNEKDGSYWFEGLSMLTNKCGKFSRFYQEELTELVEMDVKLQLLELQGVTIPNEPPKIPPLPSKPPIPNKPVYTSKKSIQVWQ